MRELTPEILAWLEPLKEGRKPETSKIRIEYEQALSVSGVLRNLGFKLEGVRLPNNISISGRHGGYVKKWQAYDYLSPESFSPKLRVIVVSDATHRPFTGYVRVEEIKEIS